MKQEVISSRWREEEREKEDIHNIETKRGREGGREGGRERGRESCDIEQEGVRKDHTRPIKVPGYLPGVPGQRGQERLCVVVWVSTGSAGMRSLQLVQWWYC